MTVSNETRPSPEDWFENLGYRLDVAQDDDGVWWASLTALVNPEFKVDRYGRGTTPEDAAARARRRWEVEQIGSSPDNGDAHRDP